MQIGSPSKCQFRLFFTGRLGHHDKVISHGVLPQYFNYSLFPYGGRTIVEWTIHTCVKSTTYVKSQ